MNEQWQQWEGQNVDAKFPLRQFLGATDHSAVFLTQLPAPQSSSAALKFLSADIPGADARLSLWKRAAQLSHPNLLTIHDSGRCSLNGRNLLYVVMEYAEENLGEILPQRALSEEEVRDVLNPALDVLVYLHAKGLAHGHLKPSNLLAAQDCLKLSSDALQTLGAPCALPRSRDIYDAPELPSSPPAPAADVWSLGATLIEALTQRPPVLPENPVADLAIPAGLPALFADIAGHGLRRRPEHRWSVAEIAARLNPTPLAAAAVASASPVPAPVPLRVPLSPEPAAPLSKLPAVAEAPARSSVPNVKRRQSSPLDYLIPALLGAAVFFVLILALPKIFNFRGQSSSTQTAASSEAPAISQPPQTSRSPEAPASVEKPAPSANLSAKAPVQAPEPSARTSPLAPAILRSDAAAPAQAKPAGEIEGRNEVLDQVLPHPSPKALATIQGTLRVVVNVHVDASGNVIGADLPSPGPSHYFADMSEKAARQWKFSGAEAGGRGVPSEWEIRFEFVSSGVQAFPKQIAP